MSKQKETYSLIAFNEVPKVIRLDLNFIQEGYSFDHEQKAASLSSIDLLTSMYDENVLREALVRKKIIDNIDTDILIVRPYKRDGRTHLKWYVPIYSDGRKYIETPAKLDFYDLDVKINDAMNIMSELKYELLNHPNYRRLLINKLNFLFSSQEYEYLLNHSIRKHNIEMENDDSVTSYRQLRNVAFTLANRDVLTNDELCDKFMLGKFLDVKQNEGYLIDLLTKDDQMHLSEFMDLGRKL